jgi:hypothetical protein
MKMSVPDEDGLYPKWNGPALFRRRSEVSPSAWALVYQQQDVQEDSIFSPLAVQGSTNRMRKRATASRYRRTSLLKKATGTPSWVLTQRCLVPQQ